MLKANYRKRYDALGFNVSSWAKRCGVERTTIIRHNKHEQSGDIDKIPSPFFVILGLLEEKHEENIQSKDLIVCPILLKKVSDIVQNGEHSGDFFTETAEKVIKTCLSLNNNACN